MGRGRKHAPVGLPLVRVVPGARAVVFRQRIPQALGRGPASVAQHPGHNATTGPLDGQPQPYFIPLVAHKSPHLIQFQHPGPIRLGAQLGRGLRFFLPVRQSSAGPRPSGAGWPVARRARPTISLPARTEPPCGRRLARIGLGGGRLCTGIWAGHGGCYSCASQHCRTCHMSTWSGACRQDTAHPTLYHRQFLDSNINVLLALFLADACLM